MTATQEDRLERARAVLGAAERRASRWGGRIDRTALQAPGGLGGPTGLVPASSAPSEPAVHEEPAETGGLRLPVPEPLAPLVPSGTLRAGSSLAVSGEASTSLLLSLAVAAIGQDTWCAIAGLPDLGLRSALDAGLDPERLAIVPDAATGEGTHTAQVLSALVDGVGVVVLGPGLSLTPALWRSLLGRARSRDTLVLAADPPGRADLTLHAESGHWQGLRAGSGRLRSRRLRVRSQGRGITAERSVEVLLPQVRGLLALAPGATATMATTASPGRTLQPVRRAG